MAVYKFPSLEPQTLEPEVLSGWKDIATYLGKGIRTVRRYEQELRLPVFRPAGKPRGSVMAVRVELNQWVTASAKSLPGQRLNSQISHDLKSGVFELHRQCAKGLALIEAISVQHTVFESTFKRVMQTLSELEFLRRMERHKSRAVDQKVLASAMIEQSREMCNRAAEMRKPPRFDLP